jgi:hypothetical protein
MFNEGFEKVAGNSILSMAKRVASKAMDTTPRQLGQGLHAGLKKAVNKSVNSSPRDVVKGLKYVKNNVAHKISQSDLQSTLNKWKK